MSRSPPRLCVRRRHPTFLPRWPGAARPRPRPPAVAVPEGGGAGEAQVARAGGSLGRLCSPRVSSRPLSFRVSRALSRAGGWGASAPTPGQSLAQARLGAGIGTRIPEAGDPKVRAATRRAENVPLESWG